MMKIGHPSKLRVLLVTLIVTTVLVLAQARRADAYGEGYAAIVFLAVAAVTTYATVMGSPDLSVR